MTLPASGQISLLDIANEHGGPTSNIALSNYYRGSGTKFVHANNTNIPASGTISEANFLGTSRFGYYWVNSAMYYNGNGNQFGWSSSPTTPFGSMDYNNRYRGQLLGWVIWNEYDHVLGVSMNGANLPQGLFSQLWTPTTGWLTSPQYVANFLGFTVWNWVWNGANPFPAGQKIECILL